MGNYISTYYRSGLVPKIYPNNQKDLDWVYISGFSIDQNFMESPYISKSQDIYYWGKVLGWDPFTIESLRDPYGNIQIQNFPDLSKLIFPKSILNLDGEKYIDERKLPLWEFSKSNNPLPPWQNNVSGFNTYYATPRQYSTTFFGKIGYKYDFITNNVILSRSIQNSEYIYYCYGMRDYVDYDPLPNSTVIKKEGVLEGVPLSPVFEYPIHYLNIINLKIGETYQLPTHFKRKLPYIRNVYYTSSPYYVPDEPIQWLISTVSSGENEKYLNVDSSGLVEMSNPSGAPKSYIVYGYTKGNHGKTFSYNLKIYSDDSLNKCYTNPTLAKAVIQYSLLDQNISIPKENFLTGIYSPDFNLNASVNTNNQLIYSTTNTGVATVNTAGLVHIVGNRGNANIIITAPRSGVYEKTYSIVNISVTGLKQNLIVPNITLNKTYGDAPFNPGITSDAGLQVSYYGYNSQTNQPLIYDYDNNGYVTIIYAGSGYISGKQDGNNIYEPANSNTGIFITINKANQSTSNFSTYLTGYCNTRYTLSEGTAEGQRLEFTIDNNNIARFASYNVLNLFKTGNVIITGINQGTLNYNPITGVNYLTILKGKQSLNQLSTQNFLLPDPAQNFDLPSTGFLRYKENLTLPLFSDQGNVINYNNESNLFLINGNNITAIETGSTIITGIASESDFFDPATGTIPFTVDKAYSQINLENIPVFNINYNSGFSYTLNGTSNNDESSIQYISSNSGAISISGSNKLIISGLGTGFITAYQPDTNHYYSNSIQRNFQVVNIRTPEILSVSNLPNNVFYNKNSKYIQGYLQDEGVYNIKVQIKENDVICEKTLRLTCYNPNKKYIYKVNYPINIGFIKYNPLERLGLANFDKDARKYFVRSNISDFSVQNKINSFITGLKDINLWNNVINVYLLNSGYNSVAGTKIYGLKTGYDGTLLNSGQASWTSSGIFLKSGYSGSYEWSSSGKASISHPVLPLFNGNFTISMLAKTNKQDFGVWWLQSSRARSDRSIWLQPNAYSYNNEIQYGGQYFEPKNKKLSYTSSPRLNTVNQYDMISYNVNYLPITSYSGSGSLNIYKNGYNLVNTASGGVNLPVLCYTGYLGYPCDMHSGFINGTTDFISNEGQKSQGYYSFAGAFSKVLSNEEHLALYNLVKNTICADLNL